MIPRLLLLITIAGCAAPVAAPAPAPPVDVRPASVLLRGKAALRAENGEPTLWMIDGVQHTDSSVRALNLRPYDIVSITIPMEGNEFAPLPRAGPRIVTIRTRRESPPARSTPAHP